MNFRYLHMGSSRLLIPLVIFVGLSACSKTNLQPASQNLSSTDDERITYNEELLDVAKFTPSFGGLHYDKEGVLNVHLLGNAPSSFIEKRAAKLGIAAVFGESFLVDGILSQPEPSAELLQNPPIKYHSGTYKFTDLYDWYSRLDSLFDIPEITLTDLDEAQNKLYVGLSDLSATPDVKAQLTKLGIPLEAVTVGQENLPAPAARLRSEKRPLHGGLQIATSEGVCTLGFNAIRNGQRGFVTNSHCTDSLFKVTGISFYQPLQRNGFLIGKEVADPRYSTCLGNYACRYSDAAFIDYNSAAPDLGYIYKPIRITPPNSSPEDWYDNTEIQTVGNPKDRYVDRFRFTTRALSTAAGQKLHKVGRTTGWTTGSVTKTCFNTRQSDPNDSTKPVRVDGKIVLFRCQYETNLLIIPGDSGSPVFDRQLYDGGQYGHRIHGLTWGGSKYRLLFSHIFHVLDDLDINEFY